MRLLALALVMSAGCISYDTDQEVCVDVTVSYAGSAQGPIITMVVSEGDTMAYVDVAHDESARLLLSGERHVEQCAPRLEHREDAATVTSWVDVDGSGSACLESGAKPQACAPAPTAPQASSTLTLPAYGRLAEPLHLTLQDP